MKKFIKYFKIANSVLSDRQESEVKKNLLRIMVEVQLTQQVLTIKNVHP